MPGCSVLPCKLYPESNSPGERSRIETLAICRSPEPPRTGSLASRVFWRNSRTKIAGKPFDSRLKLSPTTDESSSASRGNRGKCHLFMLSAAPLISCLTRKLIRLIKHYHSEFSRFPVPHPQPSRSPTWPEQLHPQEFEQLAWSDLGRKQRGWVFSEPTSGGGGAPARICTL